ncbi:signal peptidase I [Phenylobacterium sp.]|uniref:signal peptidase I n=1 Tax=Phenylobacterium sp. TaxID=1871053 RepID=UPI0035B4F949
MNTTADAPKKSAGQELKEILSTVLTALAIALVLRVALFQPFTIPSSSMEPGLVTGDYIIVSKFSYGWSYASFPLLPPMGKGRVFGEGPKRGDVVVFHLPSDSRKDLIKRVVGLPGDRVRVLGGVLFVNDKAIPRVVDGPGYDHDDPEQQVTQILESKPDGSRYVTFDRGPGRPMDDTDTYVVPDGHYFMMGDNRDNSLDSRFPPEVGGVGFVPVENIVGKAQIVLMSWKAGSSLFKPWTWLNLDGDRFFKPIS